MPDFRFVGTESTAQPNSGYASRISQRVWTRYEAFIRQTHERGSTRDEIQRVLQSVHGFQPSMGQLRDQMARWGLKSARKSRTMSGSDRQDTSSGSASGSYRLSELSLKRQPHSSSQVYSIVPDESFASMWPQFDMGAMPHGTAAEMEVLADTLFLGGRHVAAFNLYFSIYHAVACTVRFANTDLVAAARFRALVGCLRSSANSDQRFRAVSIAEQELKQSLTRAYCEPNDTNLQRGQVLPSESNMQQFADRERFRQAVARMGDVSTVSDVVRKLRIEEGRRKVLEWCFDRLDTSNFIMTYNEQVRQAGSGVACQTYGISRTTIYWYLLMDTLDDSRECPPRFAIKHTSGHEYALSVCETLAIVAAMVVSEPWLFSLDELPPATLRRWTETLLHDQAIFETVFQCAVRATMVPNFETRMAKTHCDAMAIASGCHTHRMPNSSVLRAFAARMSTSRATSITPRETLGVMDWETAPPSDPETLQFRSLVRDYSTMIKSYVSENCAYGTSYQLRERPQESPARAPRNFGAPKAFPDRPDLISSHDPTLKGGSTGSSFRSFQSTHVRSKKILAQWPELDPMSLDTNVSSNFSRQFPLPVGVR